MIDGHGRVTDDGNVGMGQRTENLVTDMGRLKQIGMVMSYGANAVIDTNGIPAWHGPHVCGLQPAWPARDPVRARVVPDSGCKRGPASQCRTVFFP